MAQENSHFYHRSTSPKPPEIHIPDDPGGDEPELRPSSPSWAHLNFLNPPNLQRRPAPDTSEIQWQQNQQALLRPGRSGSSVSSAGSTASGDSGLCLAAGGPSSGVHSPTVVGVQQISLWPEPAYPAIPPLLTVRPRQHIPNSHSSPNLCAGWGAVDTAAYDDVFGHNEPLQPSPVERQLLAGCGAQHSPQTTNCTLRPSGPDRLRHSDMDLSAYINPDIHQRWLQSQQSNEYPQPRSRSSASATVIGGGRTRQLGQSLSSTALLKRGLGRALGNSMQSGLADQNMAYQQQHKHQLNPAYKTVMCQAWLESKQCDFGEQCKFAHGEHELRPARYQPRANTKYRTKLCEKYTTTGICPFGKRCLFIHPKPTAASVAGSVADLAAVIAASSPFHRAAWNIGQYPYGWPEWTRMGTNDTVWFGPESQRRNTFSNAIGQPQQQLDSTSAEPAWYDCNPQDEGQFGSYGQFLSVPSPQGDAPVSPFPPYLTRAQTQPQFTGRHLLLPDYVETCGSGSDTTSHCPHCTHCIQRSNSSVSDGGAAGMSPASSLGAAMGRSPGNRAGSKALLYDQHQSPRDSGLSPGADGLFGNNDALRHAYSPASSCASLHSSPMRREGMTESENNPTAPLLGNRSEWIRIANVNSSARSEHNSPRVGVSWDEKAPSSSVPSSRKPTNLRLYPDEAFANTNTLRPPFVRDNTLVAADAESNSSFGVPGDVSPLVPLTPLSYAQCIADMNALSEQVVANADEEREIDAILHRQEELRKIEEFLLSTHIYDAHSGETGHESTNK